MPDYKTIAESKNFIVLDKYDREWMVCESYQSEDALEQEFIRDLENQGYEYLPGVNTPLYVNRDGVFFEKNSFTFCPG
ncbi:hypothetical protein [Prosthecochloris sp. HL-130-GSB]|uniref:hypothetical protein n=1 Tax=Prosthecochloris sp. HL-130-GSB TaxID=1974213 RepID=UPI000A1C06F7|nr:hypothetical protein [Prosthecochloris sp. HL-130-GSB]ARM30738.1 hypothetical protein B9H02_04700 [Prosthecochloris sp. HL-130-GSB]